jgi:hypothetical protein
MKHLIPKTMNSEEGGRHHKKHHMSKSKLGKLLR